MIGLSTVEWVAMMAMAISAGLGTAIASPAVAMSDLGIIGRALDALARLLNGIPKL